MSYSCFTDQRFIKDQSPVTSINTSVLSILVVYASSSASDFNLAACGLIVMTPASLHPTPGCWICLSPASQWVGYIIHTHRDFVWIQSAASIKSNTDYDCLAVNIVICKYAHTQSKPQERWPCRFSSFEELACWVCESFEIAHHTSWCIHNFLCYIMP